MDLILIFILMWLSVLSIANLYFVWWFLAVRNPVLTRFISQNLNSESE